MKYLLRFTRFLVTLLVSLHTSALRLHARLSERQAAKAAKRVADAKEGVIRAQEMVKYARLNVSEYKVQETAIANNARDCRIAADAECRFYGRTL